MSRRMRPATWPRLVQLLMSPVILGVLAATVAVSSTAADAPARPNIILMLADDQGWNGLSVAMSPDNPGSRSEIFQTPRLERFAAQGMRFSQAYAPAPVCSPTRISLQTGKSPAQLHWTKAAPPERGRTLLEPTIIKQLSPDEVTLGELLRTAGYATAHYGKWHIAGGGPGQHGYDEHDGDTGNETAAQFTDPNPVDLFGMARRAEAFMARHRKTAKPFFIQLSWNALHAPENALQATLAKYEKLTGGSGDKRTAVAAITENLDTAVGMVLDAVDRLGLAGTTYVIYTSDNGAGGAGKRGGLSGGKGSVWEGGIRVPLIVRGPGVAADAWCHVPVVGYDLLPTCCAWGGISPQTIPRSVEGGSIAPLLAHEGRGEVKRPREELVFHFPHYQGDTPHSAIRLGDLKLLRFYEDDSVKLFDLARDAGEREDLAARMPAEAARLRGRLDAYLTAVAAQLPTMNPDVDPRQPADAARAGGQAKKPKPGKPLNKKPKGRSPQTES